MACAQAHTAHPHSSFPADRASPPQLSRTTSERLPPTVKSNGRKSFLSATWTPFYSSGLSNLEGDTMRLRLSRIQTEVCQLSIWPLTGRSPAEAFHRPRSHLSPAHYVPPGCARLSLRYACAAGADREVGRLGSSVAHSSSGLRLLALRGCVASVSCARGRDGTDGACVRAQ